ncbi:MAG: hypothetical protein LBT10_04500 [Methanobrevibacter sp.]|nr:hypothetical protein [Methanobrevibacter sp.]
MRKEDFIRNCILTIPILVFFIALNKHTQCLTIGLYDFSKKVLGLLKQKRG